MLAVTGTDGKTTTTMLAAAMLTAAGLEVRAVGNTDEPLVAALASEADAFVVECSSFRLNWIEHFRSEASVWLNLAPDHQNWHVSMDAYEQAKARMWKNNRADDVAIFIDGGGRPRSKLGRLAGCRVPADGAGARRADARIVADADNLPVLVDVARS
jgi:UDP-N-acetylmuramoylalanine--D-glutamate ligase